MIEPSWAMLDYQTEFSPFLFVPSRYQVMDERGDETSAKQYQETHRGHVLNKMGYRYGNGGHDHEIRIRNTSILNHSLAA